MYEIIATVVKEVFEQEKDNTTGPFKSLFPLLKDYETLKNTG